MFCCYECKYANKYLASPLGSSPTSEMLLMILQTVQSHCEYAWGTGLQVGTLNQKYIIDHQTQKTVYLDQTIQEYNVFKKYIQ